MRKLMWLLVVAFALPGYAANEPGIPVTVTNIEHLSKGACRVAALISGIPGNWVFFVKKSADCVELEQGKQYSSTISESTEGSGEAHFHDGWECYGRDCYDTGTYYIPAQPIGTHLTAVLHAGTKNVKLDYGYTYVTPPAPAQEQAQAQDRDRQAAEEAQRNLDEANRIIKLHIKLQQLSECLQRLHAGNPVAAAYRCGAPDHTTSDSRYDQLVYQDRTIVYVDKSTGAVKFVLTHSN